MSGECVPVSLSRSDIYHNGEFNQQALDDCLARIVASGVKVAFRPNVWYWATGDANGIQFAELPDAAIWVNPDNV